MKTDGFRLWLFTALLAGGCIAAEAALTNSWVDGTGKWESGSNWSLGVAPSTNGQPSIVITNAGGNVVTIDATTVLSNAINGCLSVSDLTVSSNTLQLINAGAATPLEISRINIISFRVSTGSTVVIRNSFLRTRTTTTVDGSLLLDGGLLIGTNSATAATLYVGLSTPASVTVSNGTMVTDNSRILSGSFSMAGGTNIVEGYFENFSSTLINGGIVICTNAFTAVRSPGQTTVSNGTMVASSLEVGIAYNQSGTFTLAGGSVDAAGMYLGGGYDITTPITGTVWIVGSAAVLTVTNGTTTIGSDEGNCFPPCTGVGRLTVSNGIWRARDVEVGSATNSQGTLTVAGGFVTVSSNLTIGACTAGGGTGVVTVAGGNLLVTNSTHNGTIFVRNGKLVMAGGFLQADTILITNSCAQFVRTGGTLVYSNAVLNANDDTDGDGIPNGFDVAPLDPANAFNDSDGDGLTDLQEYVAGTNPTNSASAFRVTSITQVNSTNILITWMTGINKTNALEKVAGGMGSFTNNFATMFIVTNTVGTTTNHVDVGAIGANPARYYRVRLVP